MEYGHRMWGRSIGAFFYLPAIGFWAKGMLTPALKKRVLLAGGLLGFQGIYFILQLMFMQCVQGCWGGIWSSQDWIIITSLVPVMCPECLSIV